MTLRNDRFKVTLKDFYLMNISFDTHSTFMPDLPASYPDVEVDGDVTFDLEGVEVKFHHFPGHCPGCSMIEIGDVMFSGDFLFHNSIGRYDFPYSSPSDMKKSLEKMKLLKDDKTQIGRAHV